MDYEKKYKEALERARELHDNHALGKPFIYKTCEDIFPELKESEDERIRKKVIDVLKFNVKGAESQMQASRGVDRTFEIYACNKVIAWLEKQGERKPIISNNALREGIAHFGITQYQIDNWLKKYVDVEGNYYDGVFRALRVDELYKLQEKQGKPNPADKAQPKFKVGDWITNSIETVQITGYDIDYGYQVDYKGNLQHRDTDIIEKEYHLWAIQDAKDGDVLAEDSCTFIIEKMKYEGMAIVYCCLFDDGDFDLIGSTLCFDVDSTYPATKEQRDLLFQKMHEAGYEWDAEKKELKKSEQKPINECNTHEPTIDEARKWNEAYEKGYSLGYENGRNEQKPVDKIEQKSSWSEDDKKIKEILLAYTKWLDKRGFFKEDLQCDFPHQIGTFLKMEGGE